MASGGRLLLSAASTLVALLSACASTGPESEVQVGGSLNSTSDDSGATTSTTEVRTTTTRKVIRTTTTLDPSSETAQILCDDIEKFLDENPDARVIQAQSFASAWREALVQKGYDPSEIGAKVTRECNNGYNNELILGYGGFGPLAERLSYTLDRGSCSSRGDYGGVASLSGTGGTYAVELKLKYIAANIVEHEGSAYFDIEAGGNGVAFSFYMPSLPAGGECEVSLVSIAPAS